MGKNERLARRAKRDYPGLQSAGEYVKGERKIMKKYSIWVMVLFSCCLMSPTQAWAISDNDFLRLCGEGTYDEVVAALRAGADVNAKNKYGVTALMLAAGNENP